MAAKKKAKSAAKAKKSGAKRKATIPESRRRTERIVLRLEPEVATRLRSIAAAWHVTMAEVVTDALDSLKKKGQK